MIDASGMLREVHAALAILVGAVVGFGLVFTIALTALCEIEKHLKRIADEIKMGKVKA